MRTGARRLLLALATTITIVTTTTTAAAAAAIQPLSRSSIARPLFLQPYAARRPLRRAAGLRRLSMATHRKRAGEPKPKPEPPSTGGNAWIDLRVPPHELRPEFSLTMGQCFNWKRVEANGGGGGVKTEPAALKDAATAAAEEAADGGQEEIKEWIGVLGRRVLRVRQTPATTLVQSSVPTDDGEALAAELRDYFQLHEPLAALYARWAGADARMKTVAEYIPGVRVIRQDPAECLFSFICSSNNNIPRITLMLDRLRAAYGEPLGDGFYAFPAIDRLAAASEQELRDLGLGYRAKFIRETAQKLQELGREPWLLSLRQKERREVQEALITFPGVGRKVADCVALFSLDQKGAIPVDVHVWRIACRDYDPSLKDSKSLTPTIYERVGDLFRDKFGPHAGWAHSLLFAAELPNYRRRLPKALQEEMEAFKREESEEKAAKREDKKRRREEQEQEPTGAGGGSEAKTKAKAKAKASSTAGGTKKGAAAAAHAAHAAAGAARKPAAGRKAGASGKAAASPSEPPAATASAKRKAGGKKAGAAASTKAKVGS